MTRLVYFAAGLAVLWLGAAGTRAVTVTNIAAGSNHSLLLKSDGSLWGMGYNADGALGDGTTNNRYAPELVLSNGVTQMAGGELHTLLLKSDGSLWGMGDNYDGQLGDGTFANHSTPEEIVSNGVVAIAAGDYHSLFLKSDGSLWGMGYNQDGQLGSNVTYVSTPVEIVSNGVVAIAGGDYHSLFLKSDGSLWGMGNNAQGELGDGTTSNRFAPEEIVSSGVTNISTRYETSFFLKTNGSLWGMGYNFYGQLGIGTTVNVTNPVEIVASGVAAVAAGANHSIFLKSDGSLWGMGRNFVGQLGLGPNLGETDTPVEIVASNVTAIAAGFSHSLFLMRDGTLWAMGRDFEGELGDGTGPSATWVDVPELINAVTFAVTPPAGAVPLTVQFASPSTDFYGAPLTAWNWNLGDGSSSALQSPLHTYLNSGSYQVSLIATNNLGATILGAAPAVMVLPSFGLVVNGGFETGTFAGWNFPSGQAGASVSASATYVHAGAYGAQLGPLNMSAMSQTLSTTPGASYTLSFWLRNNNGTNNLFLADWGGNTLLNLTNLPAGAWSNYVFTVNATSASTVLQFSYDNPPSYLGLDDISVFSSVAAAVDVTNGPFPLTVHFTSPGQDSNSQTITNWDWNFGDGTPNGTSQNPVHTYLQIGTFSPSLLAENNTRGFAHWSGPAITLSTPTLQFTASPTNAAAPLSVQFTSPSADSGGSAITNWNWSFGDGATSAAQSPSHTYTVQGTFPLTLQAFNSYGMPVNVSGPAAIQSSGLVNNNSFETLNPTNSSLPAGWTIGDTNGNNTYAQLVSDQTHSGTNSLYFGYNALASQNLATTPGVGYLVSFWIYRGNYAGQPDGTFAATWNGNTIFYQTTNDVTLFMWTNIQCYVVATGTNALLQFQTTPTPYCDIHLDDVSVTPAEVEPVTATPSNGPINLTVQFNAPATDTAGQTVAAWNWDFGDGSPHSSAQNPSHAYTSVREFFVVLSATNNSGVAVPGSVLAITTALPTVQVAVNTTNGTAPLVVQFTAPTTDDSGQTITNWNWSFADSTTATGKNPLHTFYADSGDPSAYPPFQPALIGTNNAGIEVIGIVPPIWVAYNSGAVSNGGFENGFTGWTNNGAVQNSSYAYSGGNSADFDGFGVSLSQTITTAPGAGYVLSFASRSFGNLNDLEVFWNGQPLLVGTNWSAGVLNWTNFQFFVTAINTNSTLEFVYMTNGASAQLVDDVSLFPAEIEPFTATPITGPIPLTVQFTAPAADTASNAITHWDWDFGDGSPHSSAQNPSHVYPNVGSFTPVLTATAASSGTVPGASGPVITTTLPAVAITATPTNGTNPLAVQFNVAGTDSSGQAIATWNWNFGDGSASSVRNPIHIYRLDGNYTPILVATNSAGIEGLGAGPEISVALNSGLVTNGGFETGDFTGWSFPGGQSGSVVSGNSSYVRSGTYGAQLGPSTIHYLAQTLATTPGETYLLSFWLHGTGSGNQFQAQWNGNTIMNQANVPVGWTNLQFAVTASSTNTVLQFGFANPPDYFGLDDISVLPLVQFTASPTNGVAPVTVQFTGPAADSAGAAITNWTWDFGDGATSTAQNPSHVYLSYGGFQPFLAVVNNAGLDEPAVGPAITVTPPQVAFTASPTNGFAPLTVQFTAGGTDSTGHAITAWNWNFGDGGVSTAQNPLHTYVASGTFSPTLVATNNLGAPVLGTGPAVSVAFNSGIVTNGGFETGTFAGWTAQAGSVSTAAAYVHSGSYGAQLGPTTLSDLSQTLPTTPGAAYTLSFWLNGSGSPNEFLVNWNGTTLMNLTNVSLAGWTNFQFAVNASTASTVLQFGFFNGPSYFGLDDISVFPTAAAAPTLAIGRLSANQFQISWPASANLELQTASNLAPPIAWQPVTTGIVTNAGVCSIAVTNSSGAGDQFYRLAPP